MWINLVQNEGRNGCGRIDVSGWPNCFVVMLKVINLDSTAVPYMYTLTYANLENTEQTNTLV